MNKKSKTIIEGSKISKSFKIGSIEVPILKDIDISIKQGEFIILFGSSGCGKSTLLNVLLGLETPSSGKVLFLDKDFYSFDEDERSQFRKENIGLIYQQQNWIRSYTVLENTSFPLILQGVGKEEREERAIRLLEMVKMDFAQNKIPTELSVGEQQKVSFARALITSPSLLVADEPTGNLDSKSSRELMELFSDYNKKGNTVVMVTHDLKYLGYATRALNMSDGIIINEYMKGDKKMDKFKIA